LNAKKTIIAGIGNRLLRDDGFGPRVTDLLSKLDLPEHITVSDMGTAGVTTASELADYQRVIFLDAIETEASPGELRVDKLEVKESQHDLIELSRMTLHDAGIEGLLKFAKAIDTLPEEIYLIGCAPESTEMGLELTPQVEAATHSAVKKVLELIKKD
jgi:hydrogenase maturation protease